MLFGITKTRGEGPSSSILFFKITKTKAIVWLVKVGGENFGVPTFGQSINKYPINKWDMACSLWEVVVSHTTLPKKQKLGQLTAC